MSGERIDWSQLWYPGPTRRFSAEELQRAGGDRPSRTFIAILLFNIAVLVQAALQIAPAGMTARLTAVLLAFVVMGWQGCMALWRQPTRKRLAWAMGLSTVAYFLFAVGFKWRIPDREERFFLAVVMAVALCLMSLGFWFLTVFRSHQIAARLSELDERERSAAMQAQLTQAQIQPHFLFNSLASLQHWVQTQDQRAAPLLQALTAYLRATLPLFHRERLQLGEELAAVRHYLEVMQTRIGARLQVEIEVPAPLLAQTLPPALLLTLVENAIEHGVLPKLGAATVRIAARRAGGELQVEVADDGPGLPDTEAAAAPRPGRGVGLANSRLRLAQAFGTRASLTLDNAPAGGCIARLRLPIDENNKHEERTDP